MRLMTSAPEPLGGGTVPAWTLADRLSKARAHAGFNQREIAAALAISLRSVNRYEDGEPIKRGLLLGWAMACGVDAGWLEHGHTGRDDGGVTIGYPLTVTPARSLGLVA